MLLKLLLHPETGEFSLLKATLSDDVAEAIEATGVEVVKIRFVMTCQAEHGVCAKCCSRNLATGTAVLPGEICWYIIAALSLSGEPGTRLTMKTFHTGGVAEAISHRVSQS